MKEICLSNRVEKFKISSQFNYKAHFDCSVNSYFQENYGVNLNEEEKTLTFSDKFFAPGVHLNFKLICNGKTVDGCTFVSYELSIILIDGDYSFTFLKITSPSRLDFGFIISDLNSSFLKLNFKREHISFLKADFCCINSIKFIGDFVRKLQSFPMILSDFKENHVSHGGKFSFFLRIEDCEKHKCSIYDGWDISFFLDEKICIKDVWSIPFKEDKYMEMALKDDDDWDGYADVASSFEYKEYVLKHYTTIIKNKLSKDYAKREILILRNFTEREVSPLFRFVSKII